MGGIAKDDPFVPLWMKGFFDCLPTGAATEKAISLRIFPAQIAVFKKEEVVDVSLRESLQVTMLLAIGYVLHQVTPPIMLGMKPDLLLDMLFVCVLLTRNLKSAILAGILGGAIGAVTSTFPGGQIANLVDKSITAVVAYGLVTLLHGYGDKVKTVALGLLGTLFSGAVFLLTALYTVGLPGSFGALYSTVVLPTAALNTVILPILYPLVSTSQRLIARKSL